MLKLIDSFLNISADDMPEDATSFSTKVASHMWKLIFSVTLTAFFKNLLSGVTCLFIDGYEATIAIDCRTYPSRGIEEPDKDKSYAVPVMAFCGNNRIQYCLDVAAGSAIRI